MLQYFNFPKCFGWGVFLGLCVCVCVCFLIEFSYMLIVLDSNIPVGKTRSKLVYAGLVLVLNFKLWNRFKFQLNKIK